MSRHNMFQYYDEPSLYYKQFGVHWTSFYCFLTTRQRHRSRSAQEPITAGIYHVVGVVPQFFTIVYYATFHYQLESQWSGGFNANVVLTNISSIPMNGWTLAFPFLEDQKITDLWNGSSTQTGEQVTIVNLGFNGTWVSNDTSPTLFTLNGMICRT